MRLVIISADGSGTVALATDRSFAALADVAEELGRLIAAGSLDAAGTYFALDLDAASPVVVVPSAPSRPEPVAAEAPAAEAEAPEEPADQSPSLEPVEEPYAAAVVADAAEAAPVADPAEETAPAVDETPAMSWTIPDTVDVPVEASADAAPAEPVDGGQWPWDLPGAPGDDDPPAPAADAVPADAPVADAAQEDTSAVEEQPASAEDAPVLAPEAPDVEAPDVAASAAPAPSAEAADPADPLAPASDADPAASVEAAPEEPVAEDMHPAVDPLVAIGDPPRAADAVAEPQSVVDAELAAAAVKLSDAGVGVDTGYEGEPLNMNQYTCDDCVYVSTCPNQHQKKPSECGSFQWKSM